MRVQVDLDFRELIFPVVGGTEPPGADRTGLDRLYGTAFNIGGDFYLTAGHVAKEAQESSSYGLGYSEEGSRTIRISYGSDFEVLPGVDVAIIQADVPRPVRAFHWSFEQKAMLHDVKSFGFPHGRDPEDAGISTRAFKGYIVKSPYDDDPPADPRRYELSFHCPTQMSGAPLLSAVGGLAVIGIVVGNSSTEIPVYRETERVAEDEFRTVERTEATHFGIAQATTTLQDLESELLGMTVGEHFERAGLTVNS